MATDSKTRDTVTSLLNYDVSDDNENGDPFREIDTRLDQSSNKAKSNKRGFTKQKAGRFGSNNAKDDKENFDILGLDEEVKIAKKREPIAKLDEARLLSERGIPKLRLLARSRTIGTKLRLKGGKGHEYSDTAKLLGYYQLWLDDLYPRAKFADGLQMVEKVGHSKRMQVMRKEWIDEGKPGYGGGGRDDVVSDSAEATTVAREAGKQQQQQPKVGKESTITPPNDANTSAVLSNLDPDYETEMFFADAGADDHDDEPDEDELDILLAQHGGSGSESADSRPAAIDVISSVQDGREEDDDLNALLEVQQAIIRAQRDDDAILPPPQAESFDTEKVSQ